MIPHRFHSIPPQAEGFLQISDFLDANHYLLAA